MKRVFKSSRLLPVLVIMSFSLWSCDDVLEEDITDDNMTIVSPLEGTVINTNITSFQWNALDGADEYRVQVSNSISTIVVDSLVSTTSLNYSLTPGTYSWRVKGKNFAYETAYTFPVNFTVEASDDLTGQTVVLLTPSDNIYFNSPTGIQVSWETIAGADSYTFSLDRNLSGSVTSLYTEPNITVSPYTINDTYITDDAEYIWKIKALNSTTTTETPFSSRSFFLDTQVPNTPVSTNPADNASETISTEVIFVWDNGTDTGTIQSPVTSTLEIASDIGFNTIVQTYPVSNNTQGHTFTAAGDYFWRIKNADEAGNESGYSATRKVVIN